MKLRHLGAAVLAVAALATSSVGKTGNSLDEQKPIAPFTKKKEQQVKLTPKPAPAPLPQAGTQRTYASAKNYLGLELGLTSSTLVGAENYFLTADYDQNLNDEFAGDVPVMLDNYTPGWGWMARGVFDLAFNETIGLQAKLGYRNHSMGATGRDTVDFDADGFLDTEVDNNYTKTLDFLGVDALLRYQFEPDGLYGLLGLGFSSLQNNLSKGTQEDVNSDAEGQFEGELKDYYNTSRFDIKLGVGTWIPVGDQGWMLAPEIMLAIPVTGMVTSKMEDLYDQNEPIIGDISIPQMWYASVGFAIKFPFGGGESSGSTYAGSGSSSSGSASSQQQPDPGKAILRGKVTDYAGEPIDDATVTVVDLNSNQVVATDETDDGEYNVQVNAPGRYSVTADKDGYLFGSAYFEVDNDGRILRQSGDIKLASSTDGRVRLLVFFDFDKATLQPSSYPELNRAVALMKANPSMEVEIAGYTDAQGTDAYNKDLSQRRANTVRDYIVRQGIPQTRVAAVGYGESNPVATNDTEDGRAENRRVEFVVKRK
jgi:outer membrane protein OmpA-like peptidoglycan-associated protein